MLFIIQEGSAFVARGTRDEQAVKRQGFITQAASGQPNCDFRAKPRRVYPARCPLVTSSGSGKRR